MLRVVCHQFFILFIFMIREKINFDLQDLGFTF